MKPEKYQGKERKLVIEEGETRIPRGFFAFNRYLREVELPNTIKKIECGAFAYCSNLEKINIPQGCEIGLEAFFGCSELADSNGCIIFGDTLYGVSEGNKTIIIPNNVTKIVDSAFGPSLIKDRDGFTYYSWGDYCEWDEWEFDSITINSNVGILGYSKVEVSKCEIADNVIVDNASNVYKMFVKQKYALSLHAACVLYGVGSKAICSKLELTLVENISDTIKEMIDILNGLYADKVGKNFIEFFFANKDKLNDSEIDKFIAAVCKNSSNELIYQKMIKAQKKKEDSEKKEKETAIVEGLSAEVLESIKYCENNFNRSVINSFLSDKVYIPTINVFWENTKEIVPDFVIKSVIYAYSVQLVKKTTSYRDVPSLEILPDIDRIVSHFDKESFGVFMDDFMSFIESYYHNMIFAGRFGNGAKVVKIAQMGPRGFTTEFAVGKNTSYVMNVLAQQALLLNDSKEAIMFCMKTKSLLMTPGKDWYYQLESKFWIEKYAEKRNAAVSDITDVILYDFGLDENGDKEYDLGNSKIKIHLNDDYSISIIGENGTVVKSLPKKNVDQDLYKIANDDLKKLKKNIKKSAEIKLKELESKLLDKSLLFSNSILNTYLKNPVLKLAITNVVFEYENKSIIFTRNGTFEDYNGNIVELSFGKTLRIVNVFDLCEKDIEDWKKYFQTHNIKQPFRQIFDIKFELNENLINKFENCCIPYFVLEKNFEGYQASEDGIGCVLGDGNLHVRLWANGKRGYEHEFLNPLDILSISTIKIIKINGAVNRYLNTLTYMCLDYLIMENQVDNLKKFEFAINVDNIEKYINISEDRGCLDVLLYLNDLKNSL